MTIDLGIVGVGRRGKQHFKVFNRIEEANVVAVCDIDYPVAASLSKEYGVRAYPDIREMLSKEKLDALVIATPTPVHVEQGLLAAERGIDFLLEKPISLSMGDAARLLDKVRETGVLAVVGYQCRYMQIVDRMMEILGDSRIGMVNAQWYWTIPIVDWIRNRKLGGGQVVDQSTHLIDLMRFLVGEVEAVYAAYGERARNTSEDRNVGFDNWDSYALTLSFENGVVGTLAGTYALFPGLGDPALIDFICRELLVRYVHGREVRVIFREGARIFRELSDPTFRMNRSFVRAVDIGDKSGIRTQYSDSVKTLAVTLAANESAREGKAINLREFLETWNIAW